MPTTYEGRANGAIESLKPSYIKRPLTKGGGGVRLYRAEVLAEFAGTSSDLWRFDQTKKAKINDEASTKNVAEKKVFDYLRLRLRRFEE